MSSTFVSRNMSSTCMSANWQMARSHRWRIWRVASQRQSLRICLNKGFVFGSLDCAAASKRFSAANTAIKARRSATEGSIYVPTIFLDKQMRAQIPRTYTRRQPLLGRVHKSEKVICHHGNHGGDPASWGFKIITRMHQRLVEQCKFRVLRRWSASARDG